MIAGDEMRHHHAYSEFANANFQSRSKRNDVGFSIYDETKNHNASSDF